MAIATCICVGPAALEDDLVTAFCACDFTGYALSVSGDQLECACYAEGEMPAAVLVALRRIFGGEPQVSAVEQADLLRGLTAEEACELAPGWWIDPGTRGVPDDAQALAVPPGTAFGDGRHPSTRIAARLLCRLEAPAERVLDLGCGTGVLGVLAARLGASHVAFSDIAPEAIAETTACCAANGIRPAWIMPSDLLQEIPPEPVDLVIANLYADLLLDVLADPRLDAILPRGELIVSGIASAKWPALSEALTAARFAVAERDEEAWWCGARCWRE